MRSKASVFAIGAIIVLAIGLYAAAFTVNLRETALVLQFGEPKRVITEPGLYFRVPVIESVTYLDKRVRNFDVEPQLLLTREQKRVLIFLAVWLGSNFLSSVLAQPLGLTDASIAWEAHVGGFLVGLVLFPFLDPLDPRPVGSSLKRT